MDQLPAVFTDAFADLYRKLPRRDVGHVDLMLDRLEEEHGTAEMRTILKVGQLSIYATPRIHAPSALYRITWLYDNRDDPTAIVCVTVAEI